MRPKAVKGPAAANTANGVFVKGLDRRQSRLFALMGASSGPVVHPGRAVIDAVESGRRGTGEVAALNGQEGGKGPDYLALLLCCCHGYVSRYAESF